MANEVGRLENVDSKAMAVRVGTLVLLLMALTTLPALAGFRCVTYKGNQGHAHLLGRASGNAWYADPGQHSKGFMSYGPYDSQYTYGNYTAMFKLKSNYIGGNNDTVAIVDVVTNFGARVLGKKTIRKRDFTGGNVQVFSIDFENPARGMVETRVYFNDKVRIDHLETRVCGEFEAEPYPAPVQ